MWNPLNNLRTGARFALVFDIATSSVASALITHHHKRSTSPKILWTSRTDMQFSEGSGAEKLASALQGALLKSVEDATMAIATAKNAPKHFDIHVVAHAPWVTSNSEYAKSNFNAEVTIKKDIVKRFMEQSFKNLSNNTNSILEAHITKVELNDYPVKEPLGKSAKSIGISLMTCSMHSNVKSAIKETLESAFPGKSVYMHSFVYTMLKLADKLGVNLHRYVLADIGGEYTEFTVIDNRSVTAHASVEFGSNYLLRTIAQKLNVPIETAKTKFTMFSQNTCTPTECKNVREALQDIEGKWIESFGSACAELLKTSKLPDSVFLSSAMFVGTWLTNSIEKLDFAQFTLTSKPFKVHSLIDPGAHAALYNNMHITRDRRLLIDSLFVDKHSTLDTYEKLFML